MIPVELLNEWGGIWIGFVTRTLIETCVLLALVLVVWLPLRRRMSAQLGHGLFCLVLLKLIVPVPLTGTARQALSWMSQVSEQVSTWTVPVEAPPDSATLAVAAATDWSLPSTGDVGASLTETSFPQPIASAVQTGLPGSQSTRLIPPSTAKRQPAQVFLSAKAALMLTWAGCVVLLLARFIRAMVRTRRLLRQAVPLPSERLPIDVESLRRAVGLRGSVRWAVDARLDSPAVGGLFRPAVVIPPDLNDSLTPNQLTWVLLHELAHVRRGDLWVVVFQRIVQAVFFFNPAVHLANWIIDELREYACDDAALAACKTSRSDCGEGFLAIIERSAGCAPVAAPALGLFEGRMLIRRRLMRILDNHRKVHARLSWPAAFGLIVLALALCVLPYGAAGKTSAGPQNTLRSIRDVKMPLVDAAGLSDEPVSYQAGAIWRLHGAEDPPQKHSDSPLPNGRGGMLAVAYSPDGSMLASAGDDAVIRLRDLASGRTIRLLEGHSDAVSCLAFSPDGRTLASGSYDRTVRLWDVRSRRLKATLSGHSNWVFSVAFSAEGATLASGGHDKTIRIWDAGTGSPRATLEGHMASVRAVAFAPDDGESLLASGGADQAVLVWDLRTHTIRFRLTGHKGTVRTLAFAPDGGILASGGEDGEVRMWDTNWGHLRTVLAGHTDMVTCLAFSPRGGILATGSLDATIKLWEARAGRERASLQGHIEGVSALAFAPDARQLATASFDGSVRIWDPAAPIFSPAACLAYAGEPGALAYSPDGRSLRAAGAGGLAHWDIRAGTAFPRSGSDATALAVAPDGTRYATGESSGKVVVYDTSTDERVAEFDGHHGTVQSVTFSADSRLLASGDQLGVVRLWDASARQPLGALPAFQRAITCVQFSPGRRMLAVATGDSKEGSPGSITLWEVSTRGMLGALEGYGGARSFAFSSDGATIATAGGDGVVRLWQAATRSLRTALNYSGCQSVAFSPDARLLAAAHQGGDVMLWDGRGSRQLGLLKGHRDAVKHVVFAPDGRSVATASKDQTVKLWSLATRRQTSRATLKRELTPVRAVAYSPDGKTLAVADGPPDAGGRVTLWDLVTRTLTATLEGHERDVVTVVFSPDGRSLASGSCDGTIRISEIASGTCRHELAGLSGLTELAFSPDGRLLASAGEGNIVTLWDVETGRESSRLTDLRFPVYCVAFSPDGTQIVTGGGTPNNRGSGHGELKIWDVAKQSVVATLGGHEGAVLSVGFSADGLTLASGGVDETIRLWDVKNARVRLTLGGLSSCVLALAVSPDGRTLASTGRLDGLVSLRDAMTGAELVRFVGHSALVRGIAFAPDGRSLATGGDDRSIKLWDVPSSEPSRPLSMVH
jgi:WD40 repeat protein/beta-lactamase regulating signal transducer with metallopeptidase domain